MTLLKDVIYYILYTYPSKEDLSNYRTTKMIYLIDWYYSIKYKKQLTNINWFFDNYGPFVWDIKDTVVKNENVFNIEHTKNYYGSDKTLFSIKDLKHKIELSDNEKSAIDYIIELTKNLGNDSFTKLVYSTYPMIVTEQYHKLDLVARAKEYQELKQKRKKDTGQYESK